MKVASFCFNLLFFCFTMLFGSRDIGRQNLKSVFFYYEKL